MASHKMYLYLARRDKTDVKVLMTLWGEMKSGRIDNLSSLRLPNDIQEHVNYLAHENRMFWEVWIDPAGSYHQLKEILYKRGFKNVPVSSNSIISPIQGKQVDTKEIKPSRPIMIQKKN